jgi:hypothetical protein
VEKQLLIANLELIAAKAKSMAIQAANGGFWPGELGQGLGEIHRALETCQQSARDDR